MELTRWHALAASSFLEANAGLQYVFGDVSGALRTRLGYTQRQLDGLGTAKDCGTAVVDVLAGFLFDAAGAAATLSFIAALNALGFLAMLAVYSGALRASYSRMVLFTALGFGGNGAMLLPGLVTSLGNFPEVRGMVTGLLKSVFFLCASLYTEWDVALHENASAFLLLLALLPAAVALACIPLLKHLPPPRGASSAEGVATRRTFFAASGLTLLLALFMALTVETQTQSPKTFLPLLPLSFGIMLLLLSLYALLPAAHARLGGSATAPLLPPRSAVAEYGAAAKDGPASDHAEAELYVGDAANIPLSACLQRGDYWCIYSLYVANLAVGLTLSNNLEAVAGSKGAAGAAPYVALGSIGTCLGCLLGAHASEAALDPPSALPRPWCLLPAFACISAGSLMVALGGRGALYTAVAVTMFGYGANLSVLPAILHERFGQRHYGSIWAFSQTAMVLASSLFATGLAARVYTAHAVLDAAGVQTCVGAPCFRDSFLVLSGLALCGVALAAALAVRLRGFYAELAVARHAASPGGYWAALGFGKARSCDDL